MDKAPPKWAQALGLLLAAAFIMACGELTLVNNTSQTVHVVVALNDRTTSSVRALAPGASTGFSTDDDIKYNVTVLSADQERELEQKYDEFVTVFKRYNAKQPGDDPYELRNKWIDLAKQVSQIRNRPGNSNCGGKVPGNGTSAATITSSSGGKIAVSCADTPPKETK